ncbi:MAG: radical SAM family heme chaperone HemW [Terriglobales bacterium]
MALGVYISVPFCRTKCSFCNFASDVFSRTKMQSYVDRVIADMERAPAVAQEFDAELPREVDSIYLGGGTPSTLAPEQLVQLFDSVRRSFSVLPDAEVTVECAPGTLTPEMIGTLLRCGVNRVSLGVQSFVDQESRAVGRLHTRQIVLDDIVRLRAGGINEISVDLIAGLPHQTRESWIASLEDVIASGVPHVSVYMLEVDEDSRLGKELLAGGQRYHAHFVPKEDDVADFYELACERLSAGGIAQYEISNFARAGHESEHNLKYWTREPYIGFGVDAHSMLPSATRALDAVRFATTDSLEKFDAGTRLTRTDVTEESALEEEFFLGLRLCRGVALKGLSKKYGSAVHRLEEQVNSLIATGFLRQVDGSVSLTAKGRLLSNDVFERLLLSGVSS